MYILDSYNIIYILILIIGCFVFCMDSNIFYSRRIDWDKIIATTGAIGTSAGAYFTRDSKKTREERDSALKATKDLQEEISRIKHEVYEEEIKKYDALTKIASQEAEIEELKEEINKLKLSESKTLDSDNKESSDTSSDSSGSGKIESSDTSSDSLGSGYFRSPNEDNLISSIYNNIMDKIKYIEDLDLLQIYAMCNLILLLVLVSSINTCLVYVLNTYLLEKYNISHKYPYIYKYIRIYRNISYYSALLNLCLIIIIIIALICLSILYLS